MLSNRYGSRQVAEYRWNWVPGAASSRNSWPAPRNARPYRKSSQLVGSRQMSKFRSFRTIDPLSPAFELTLAPIMNCPVRVSPTSTIRSLYGLSKSFWTTVIRGGFSGSKMPSRASRASAAWISGYGRICPGRRYPPSWLRTTRSWVISFPRTTTRPTRSGSPLSPCTWYWTWTTPGWPGTSYTCFSIPTLYPRHPW